MMEGNAPSGMDFKTAKFASIIEPGLGLVRA